MKLITSAILIIFLGLSFTANAAMVERSIDDRDMWLENAASMIQAGDFDGLEQACKATLGAEMHEDVEDLLTPLRSALQERDAIYVDKIRHVEMGQSFDQHIYAAFYGQREFVFYSFTFARLENGWQLYSINFADSLAGLDAPAN